MSKSDITSKPNASSPDTLSESELYNLKDKAHLFDLVCESASFVSFYAGYDAQGGAFRETLVIKRDHNDNVLYNMAMRKAKKLGATSWCVFKPMGVPHNVSYGRYGDESRLDFIETVNDLVATDSSKHTEATQSRNNKEQGSK